MNVTYTIELTPENAPKIDQINALLMGTAYTAETSETSDASSAPAKGAKGKSNGKSQDAAGNEITFESLKEFAKKCKAEYGQEWMLETLEEMGVEVTKQLATSLKRIPEYQYQEVKKVWAAGPQEEEEEEGEEGEESEVTPDAVADAVRAYKKEHDRDAAKAMLKKHGFSSLSELDEGDPEDLAALFADLQGDDDDDI